MTWHWFCTDMREKYSSCQYKKFNRKIYFRLELAEKEVCGALQSKYVTPNLYSTNRLSSTFAYDFIT